MRQSEYLASLQMQPGPVPAWCKPAPIRARRPVSIIARVFRALGISF